MPTDWVSHTDDTITVVAAGEIRARANVMHLVLEIRTRAASASEALQENNLRERATRLRLRDVGVHEESIESSGVTFMAASGDGVTLPGATEPQGFVATRSLTINSYMSEEEMSQIAARVARILDEACEAGAQAGARHQVNLAIFRSPCVSYVLDNDTAERNEALHRAVNAAHIAAEEMARSTGVELDGVASTQVLELGALIQARWAAGAMGMPGLDVPRPPEAGRVIVRAVVSITYRSRRLAPRPERERLEAGHYTLEAADTAPSSHTDQATEIT
ncbi:MAG TPA: SIMPL domain-containing protein [Armatimonadota bacterium]|nr:SIMPL domain-containing protein [Armatimonadota bacterium]